MTNKYSFIDVFNQEIQLENKEPVLIKKIIIPIIQRDYAQGRNDADTKRIRKRFLDALYSAIVDKPITLDFIYGDIDENGIMTPLDGQQRLTTLFLLHWYAVKKEENIDEVEYQFLNKFGYETRYSARRFCEKLVKFTPSFNKETLSIEIINQSWFPLDWKKDQTIKSMLVLLDDIDEKFKNISNIWSKIKENKITFYFLPIKDMGLTDELYIKMNSRGKPLTAFENFKAELEHEMKEVNPEVTKEIIKKIDMDWTDLLWEYRSEENIIDDNFLHYFRFICDVICYKNGDSPLGTTDDEIDLLKKYFSIQCSKANENIKLLSMYFDCWVKYIFTYKTQISDFFNKYIAYEHETNKIRIDSRYEIDIFKDCLKNYGIFIENSKSRQFPLGRFVVLYAFITYLINYDSVSEEEFIRRIRIINNLVNNSENEISNSTSRIGGNRMPAILKQVDSIIVKGIIVEDIDNNFNTNQLKEEIAKLEWTYQNSELANKLYELEDNIYLYGQISVIGLENSNLFEKFNQLMKCNLDKVDCALMAIGNYGQIDRWRFQLGTGSVKIRDAWNNLFHQGSLKNFENTKAILVKLLEGSEFITDEYLNSVIYNYMKKCEEEKIFEWRYYYIKYNKFRPASYGKFYWNKGTIEKTPYEFLVMVTNHYISENTYNPFLKIVDIDNRLSKKDFGDKIIYDDYYIICTNNAYEYRRNENDEIIKSIIINQNEFGVDTEDRIEKYLKVNNIENFKPDIIFDEKIKIINIISDERDYSRANPQKYTYKDNTREVEHWTDFYVKLLNDLYEEYGEEFVKVAFNNKNFGTDAPSFSDIEDDKFREYKKISENLYCETNNNTSKKLRNLREIFRQLDISSSDLEVLVVFE